MSSKNRKILSLSKRDSSPDYLKIIRKKSLELKDVVDECKCKISKERFSSSSIKHSQITPKSRNAPSISTRPHNIVNYTQRKDNYGWFKITVLYGQKYGKKKIISSLLKYIDPLVFTPVMYREEGSRSVFYVDNERIATKLKDCNEKIKLRDGYKLMICVKRKYPESGVGKLYRRMETIDKTLVKKLKYVASKRLCEKTKTLDLTRFHCDPDLADDYFCALFISNIFSIVVDFIEEYMPDLEVLKLPKNNLRLSSTLARDISKFSHLKALYLNDNLIRNMNGLTLLKNLKLEEFYLSGNPLRGLDTHKQNYVQYIRDLFPTLLVLDGKKIREPIVVIKIEEDDEKELPVPIKNFFCSSEVHEIARQFIIKYFTTYDSDSREPLLSLYDRFAFFSMTLSSITSQSHNLRSFDDYNSFHRNLLTMKTKDQRRSLLKQGRLSIVTLLSLLPNSHHDLKNFSTDVTMQKNKLMINISGCFKEVNTKLQLIFYFSRTFIIAVEGGVYTILNDQLYLSDPTSRQTLQFTKDSPTIVSTSLSVPEIMSSPTVSTSDVSESDSKVYAEPMEINTPDVNSTNEASDSQVFDNSVKEYTSEENLIPISQTQDELMEKCASDIDSIPSAQLHCELKNESISDNNTTSNLEEMNECTSDKSASQSEVFTESPTTPRESTPEPEATAHSFEKKLTYLKGILGHCLFTIEELLNDKNSKNI